MFLKKEKKKSKKINFDGIPIEESTVEAEISDLVGEKDLNCMTEKERNLELFKKFGKHGFFSDENGSVVEVPCLEAEEAKKRRALYERFDYTMVQIYESEDKERKKRYELYQKWDLTDDQKKEKEDWVKLIISQGNYVTKRENVTKEKRVSNTSCAGGNSNQKSRTASVREIDESVTSNRKNDASVRRTRGRG